MTEGKAILYIAGTLLLVGLGLYRYFQKRKLQIIAKNRPKLHKLEFIKRMESQGYTYAIIDEVYDEVNKLIKTENFDLYPEDKLFKLLKMDTLQVENLIDRLLEELDLLPPKEEHYKKVFQENDNVMNPIYILKLLHLCKNKPVK